MEKIVNLRVRAKKARKIYINIYVIIVKWMRDCKMRHTFLA